jgi:hypothetical protein
MEILTIENYLEVIPYLKNIPNDILYKLSVSEFFLPNNEILEVMAKLGRNLDAFIMSYNSQIFNLHIELTSHLCAHLQPVILSKSNLKILQNAEKELRLKGYQISFSAYKKPLVLIDPYNSPLFKLYQS